MDFLKSLFGDPANDPKLNTDNMQALLQYLKQPTANDRLMAVSKALSDFGAARAQGGDIGMALGAAGQGLQGAIGQGREGRMNELQTQMALKKLWQKPVPKRVESFGQDAKGNPVKFQEDVNEETGARTKVEGSDIPYWQPKSDELTAWQKAQLSDRDALNELKLQNLQSQIDARNAIVSDKEAKRQVLEDKNAARAAAAKIQAENVLNTVGEAKSAVTPWSAGWGSKLSGIPTSEAKDLASKLETVKANLGFDRLQQMRDMSPTGGALGAVAVQELTALQSTVANLDQAQSPDELRKSLDKIAKHYEAWKKTVEAGSQTVDNTDDDLINRYLD